jgi:hypothetical protein
MRVCERCFRYDPDLIMVPKVRVSFNLEAFRLWINGPFLLSQMHTQSWAKSNYLLTDSQFAQSVPLFKSIYTKTQFCLRKTAYDVATKSFGGAERLRAEIKRRYVTKSAQYQEKLNAWVLHKTGNPPNYTVGVSDLKEPSEQSGQDCNVKPPLFVLHHPLYAHFSFLMRAASADKLLLRIAPPYWWDVCGVAKPPLPGCAFERGVVEDAIEVLCLAPEQGLPQFRQSVEHRMGRLFPLRSNLSLNMPVVLF